MGTKTTGGDHPDHHVVIIGSGFGGLFAARALRRAPVRLTVIDRTNHHLFQPLLYQVATGILSEGEIAPAMRDVLRRQKNASVILGNVTHIDLAQRRITADQMGRTLTTTYDSLIVAAGVQTSYFGHPEFSTWAPGMKTIDDALELRGRIFNAFEVAESEPDPELRKAWLTFVVVGGGPTGIEMAGQIRELSHRALRHNFRRIDPSTARVVLFEGGAKILAPFGDRLSRITTKDLSKLGVEVRTDSLVASMDAFGVDVKRGDGSTEHVEARTIVWAAGMEASPLGKVLADNGGVELDRIGRVRVLDNCSVPAHPEVFVVGDLMSLGENIGMAEVAIQSGRHSARMIERRIKGQSDDEAFKYHDLGSLATISRFKAVAKLGRLSIGGFVGWVLWLVVHLTFLTGFKNRLSALAHWAISFIGRGRSERTVTEQQVVARHAIAGSHWQTPDATGSNGSAPADLGQADAEDISSPASPPAPARRAARA